MTSWFRGALLVLASTLPTHPAPVQEPAAGEVATGDFFSGTVVSFTTSQVVVFRKSVGKDTAMTRTFLIDAATKVEGVLRTKAHITVRFAPADGNARAVHIIVR